MTKEIVSAWFNRLSEKEKDLPLLLSEGYVYTPRATYNEVMRNSDLGNKLQALIETGRFGTSNADEQAIARTRLELWLKQQPDKPILFATLSNKIFTPSQLLQEIQSGTQIGVQWTTNEISHMKTLMTVR